MRDVKKDMAKGMHFIDLHIGKYMQWTHKSVDPGHQ